MSGDYKIYCIGEDGRIEKRHDYMGADDLAALEHARRLCWPHDIEVWERARFVARLSAKGEISYPAKKVSKPD